MWAFLRRTAPPIVLLLAGAALIVVGATHHDTKVVYEDTYIPPPPPPPPEPPPGLRGPGGFGPRMPFMPPEPPAPPPEPVLVFRTIIMPERQIILEATRGGVVRLADGRIKRTYSGAPPSGCPT